jgi:hypothetical protein
MGSWYNKETREAKEKIDESEDDDTFGNDGGYSSDRARSRHSGAWKTGQLRDKMMKGGKRGENQNGSDESSGSEEEERTYTKTPDKSDPPLFSVPAAVSSGRPAAASSESPARDKSDPPMFSVPAAVSSGRPAAASSESPARNTRMAIRKGEATEKKLQKRRKMQGQRQCLF